MSPYYSTQAPKVAVQQFDDEVLLVNFATGVYYSLTGSAADIWLGISSGASLDEIAQALGNCQVEGNLPMTEVVKDFVDRLLAEKIIIPYDGSPDRLAWAPQFSTPYSQPMIHRFDDLRDLLLLDPVHNVGQAGWPWPMSAKDGS